MNFVKNTIKLTITYAAMGAACVIGYMGGYKLWEEKIEPALSNRAKNNKH